MQAALLFSPATSSFLAENLLFNFPDVSFIALLQRRFLDLHVSLLLYFVHFLVAINVSLISDLDSPIPNLFLPFIFCLGRWCRMVRHAWPVVCAAVCDAVAVVRVYPAAICTGMHQYRNGSFVAKFMQLRKKWAKNWILIRQDYPKSYTVLKILLDDLWFRNQQSTPGVVSRQGPGNVLLSLVTLQY